MDILTWAYFHGALALMAHRLSFLVFPNRFQLSFAFGLEFDKYGFQRFQPGVEFFWQRRMLSKWFKLLAG